MAKKVWVDFFRVEFDADRLPDCRFSDMLDRTMKRPPERRVLEYYDSHLRLDNCTWDHDRHLCVGIIHKIRMDELPVISRPDGAHERSVPLEQDEGLNEDTHFVYSSRTGCVGLHRNWNAGVRHATFPRYFEKLLDINGIELNPLTRGNPEFKLDQMVKIRKYTIKIATPNPQPPGPGEDESVGRAFDLLGDSHGQFLHINVSAGQSRSCDLNTGFVKRLMHAFRRQPDTTCLKVRGADSTGGPLEWLDLLQDRISTQVQVEHDGRNLSRVDFATKLRNAYNSLKDEIEQLFGIREG